MAHPYAALTPDVVLDASDAAGFRADGRLLPLNSYENRVYQVWLDDGSARVLKFYRPGRWSASGASSGGFTPSAPQTASGSGNP